MRWISIAIVLVAACGKGDQPPAPTSGSPTAQPETGPHKRAPEGGPDDVAMQIFASQCATCHGMGGKGDGPAAASLTPRPRDYTDAAWQASVSDDDLKKTIVLGGQKIGKSPMMPANAQLESKPEVLDGLVRIIRRFGKH